MNNKKDLVGIEPRSVSLSSAERSTPVDNSALKYHDYGDLLLYYIDNREEKKSLPGSGSQAHFSQKRRRTIRRRNGGKGQMVAISRTGNIGYFR